MKDGFLNLRQFAFSVLAGAALGALTLSCMITCGRRNASPRVTPARTTILTRDTVNVGYNADDLDCPQGITGGDYDILTNRVNVYVQRDTTDNQDSREFTDQVNDAFRYCDYHEVRHALNSFYIRKYAGPLDEVIFALDEVAARTAQILAEIGDMSPLPAGRVPVDVNYVVDCDSDGVEAATFALDMALETIAHKQKDYYFSNYSAIVARASHIARTDEINYDALSDSLMTFRINGRRINAMRSADASTRAQVSAYLMRAYEHREVAR